jgi:hypothetical protein
MGSELFEASSLIKESHKAKARLCIVLCIDFSIYFKHGIIRLLVSPLPLCDDASIQIQIQILYSRFFFPYLYSRYAFRSLYVVVRNEWQGKVPKPFIFTTTMQM